MHEYSIVQSLMQSCEENARANNATQITKVVVKIGVMSGVEPQLLQTAFDTFKEETICSSAEFIMIMQSLKIWCNDCKGEYILPKDTYNCPQCAGVELDILDGEDIYLMQLEMV